jgi:hypothetical protein
MLWISMRLSDPSVITPSSIKADGAHLLHKRRVEADLVDAIEDIRRASGQLSPEQRIDADDHDVAAITVIYTGKYGRVPIFAEFSPILTVQKRADRSKFLWVRPYCGDGGVFTQARP